MQFSSCSCEGGVVRDIPKRCEHTSELQFWTKCNLRIIKIHEIVSWVSTRLIQLEGRDLRNFEITEGNRKTWTGRKEECVLENGSWDAEKAHTNGAQWQTRRISDCKERKHLVFNLQKSFELVEAKVCQRKFGITNNFVLSYEDLNEFSSLFVRFVERFSERNARKIKIFALVS